MEIPLHSHSYTAHTPPAQVFDQCVASANAAYPAARLGIQQYLALGADPQKLVLGAWVTARLMGLYRSA